MHSNISQAATVVYLTKPNSKLTQRLKNKTNKHKNPRQSSRLWRQSRRCQQSVV